MMELYSRLTTATIMISTLGAASSYAMPTLEKRTGTTIADRGTPDYSFSEIKIRGEKNGRDYQLRIARPNLPPPPSGYPVIYFLDGNAVMMLLNDSLMYKLAKSRQPPVLVMIAYDNDLRIDLAARSHDYTPTQRVITEGINERWASYPGGGGNDFLQFITDKVKPTIEARIPVDRRQQSLWGHSYGGLFVLFALFNKPNEFHSFFSVEPSLWWDNGVIIEEAQHFISGRQKQQAHIYLWFGEQADINNTTARRAPAGATPLSPDAPDKLASQLRSVAGKNMEYTVWKEKSHKDMFEQTVPLALDEVSR